MFRKAVNTPQNKQKMGSSLHFRAEEAQSFHQGFEGTCDRKQVQNYPGREWRGGACAGPLDWVAEFCLEMVIT